MKEIKFRAVNTYNNQLLMLIKFEHGQWYSTPYSKNDWLPNVLPLAQGDQYENLELLDD